MNVKKRGTKLPELLNVKNTKRRLKSIYSFLQNHFHVNMLNRYISQILVHLSISICKEYANTHILCGGAIIHDLLMNTLGRNENETRTHARESWEPNVC